MLSLSHISFSYGLVQILDDVSIEVPKAKVVCVMGRNGVGKTTLMRNIVGLEKASKGTVTLDGRDITKTPARKRAQSGLALVPLIVAGNAPGHEIEHPMAIVILGGLISSTALNLLLLPALYARYGEERAVPPAAAPKEVLA